MGGEVLRNVGPQDVDRAGELVRSLGVRNQGRRLLRHVARQRPAAVLAAQSRPEDHFRTLFLDADEVRQAAVKAFGKKAVKTDGAVYGRVRGAGSPEEELVVVVLFETPSGRTSRGVLRYTDFEAARKRYEDAVADGAFNPYVDSDDGEALRKELAAARAEVRRLERERGENARTPRKADKTAEEAGNDDGDDDGGVSAADVGADLAGRKAEHISQRLPDLSDEELDALEAAERDGRERVTVLAAIEAERGKR